MLFTLLFGITSLTIILSFAEFRAEEFKERLEKKALTSINLLVGVKEVNDNLLRIIDQNSVPQLYNERTIIFDDHKKVIYSTYNAKEDHRWTESDLSDLIKNKKFYIKKNDIEILGVKSVVDDKNYYAFLSAIDKYGNRKQEFLVYTLLIVYVLFTITTWFLTFFVVKNQLEPLNYFLKRIANINEKNLDSFLIVKADSVNEINLLSNEFNYMLKRINDGYLKQKEFTSNASHELRTPLARISAQLENHIPNSNPASKPILISVLSDVRLLNELINSLILLAKLDSHSTQHHQTTRIDEVLYLSIHKISHLYNDIKVSFNIAESLEDLDLLEVDADQNLLQIAFINLLKNAYQYSNNKNIDVTIYSEGDKVFLSIQNDGETINDTNQKNLFMPFVRGNNARNTQGLGLGLRIVRRIFDAYKFDVRYFVNDGLNEFRIKF